MLTSLEIREEVDTHHLHLANIGHSNFFFICHFYSTFILHKISRSLENQNSRDDRMVTNVCNLYSQKEIIKGSDKVQLLNGVPITFSKESCQVAQDLG